jgi:hypothetical protein
MFFLGTRRQEHEVAPQRTAPLRIGEVFSSIWVSELIFVILHVNVAACTSRLPCWRERHHSSRDRRRANRISVVESIPERSRRTYRRGASGLFFFHKSAIASVVPQSHWAFFDEPFLIDWIWTKSSSNSASHHFRGILVSYPDKCLPTTRLLQLIKLCVSAIKTGSSL